MKKAVLLVLLMSLSVLSGCISGDDGELQVEVSDEQIDSIVDEYFTDFVNNTSIIVNDFTTSGTNTTNNYYSNGSFTSSEQLFVVDFSSINQTIQLISHNKLITLTEHLK